MQAIGERRAQLAAAAQATTRSPSMRAASLPGKDAPDTGVRCDDTRLPRLVVTTLQLSLVQPHLAPWHAQLTLDLKRLTQQGGSFNVIAMSVADVRQRSSDAISVGLIPCNTQV